MSAAFLWHGCPAGQHCERKHSQQPLLSHHHPSTQQATRPEFLQPLKVVKRQRNCLSTSRTALQEETEVEQEPEEVYIRDVPPEGRIQVTEEEYKAIMANLPVPHADMQQTLRLPFTVTGYALHSGKEGNNAVTVRVRPAFAGEGRYFVRVPEGALPKPPLSEEEPETQEEVEQDLEAALPNGSRSAKAQDSSDDDGIAEASTEQAAEDEEIQRREPDPNVILAAVDNAVVFPDNCLFMTLQNGEHRVYGAEVLLSALEACGVDNARIEVEGGGELPLWDGNAVGWAEEIQLAGLQIAPTLDGTMAGPREPLAPHKVVTVQEGDAFLTYIPCSSMRVSYGIDHTAEARVIGTQWASWSALDVENAHYKWTIAPARSYVTSPQEVFNREAKGYYKAGTLPAVIIADGDRWYKEENDDNVGYELEQARRRLQELIGDLALLSEEGRGGIPQGHVVAFQASRDLHLRFIRALRKVAMAE